MHPTFLAPRPERPSEDPIFGLHNEAKRRSAEGHPVVDATVGVLLNDDGKLAILPSAAQAWREVSPEGFAAYAPISGRQDFLDAVVDDLFGAIDPPIAKEHAVAAATPGGTGALRVALTTFLSPGDTALTSGLHWPAYATLCEEHERGLSTFNMFAQDGSLDVDAFESALEQILAAQGRALVILNDPCHNPTGYSMSDEDWSRITAAVERHAHRGPIAVLLDAAYAGYAPEAWSRSLEHLLTLSGKALPLIAWSASKLFTAYGLRVGALVAVLAEERERKRIKASFNFACRGTWSNGNHAGMIACTRLLADPAMRNAVNAERAELIRVLDERVSLFNRVARAGGLDYPRYEGGFFVSVNHARPDRAAELLRQEHVFVVPQKKSLRIALCAVPTQEVVRVAKALCRVAEGSLTHEARSRVEHPRTPGLL